MERRKFLSELRKYGKLNDIPNISEINAKFLCDLIKIKKPKKILEIGTANGFSTICFGIELEKFAGTIDSIEFSSNSHNQAKENIKKASLEATINLILGNALDEISRLEKGYDFVFIDAMKRRTKDFLELVWDKVNSEGIIIIDDVIKFREKMLGLWEYLDEKNIDYNIIPIDKDDGVMMIIKGENEK